MNEVEIKGKLKEVLVENHLVGIIFADIDGKNSIVVGELENLPEKGLIQTLFGGETEIKNLYSSLEGTILPQGWGQGKVRCYVDLTANEKIFGIFIILEEGKKFEDLKRQKTYMEQVKNTIEKLSNN